MKKHAVALQDVAKRGLDPQKVRRAVSRVGHFSLQAQDRLSEGQRVLKLRCDRELRRLANRARGAVGRAVHPGGPVQPSAAERVSPLTTVALGAGLELQITAEVARLREDAALTANPVLRSRYLGRAAELTTHLDMLREASGRPAAEVTAL